MAQLSSYDRDLLNSADRYMEELDRMTCQNCTHYLNGYCWKNINNMDESLLNKEEDERAEDDYCEDWEYNELADD